MYIAVYNDKGGCAKSTFVREMSLFLERKRRKPLIIDLDYKHSITKSFEIDNKNNITHVLEGIKSIEDVIVETDYIDIVPGDYSLRNCDINVNLRDKLASLEGDYDYFFFDTALEDRISDMAIYTSDAVIVPIIPQKYDVDNLKYTLDHINKVSENNQKIFILIMRCDKSEDGLYEIERIKKIAKDNEICLFVNSIRNDETVKSVQEKGKELRSYDFVSEAAEDYKSLTDEFISKFDDYKRELIKRIETVKEEEVIEIKLGENN